jgi:hypothetical protein
MAGGEERLLEPQSGQEATECGIVSQARRMANLYPGNWGGTLCVSFYIVPIRLRQEITICS